MSVVKDAALDLIGTETLEDDMPLMEAGLDSLAAVEYQSILTKAFVGVNNRDLGDFHVILGPELAKSDFRSSDLA